MCFLLFCFFPNSGLVTQVYFKYSAERFLLYYRLVRYDADDSFHYPHNFTQRTY